MTFGTKYGLICSPYRIGVVHISPDLVESQSPIIDDITDPYLFGTNIIESSRVPWYKNDAADAWDNPKIVPFPNPPAERNPTAALPAFVNGVNGMDQMIANDEGKINYYFGTPQFIAMIRAISPIPTVGHDYAKKVEIYGSNKTSADPDRFDVTTNGAELVAVADDLEGDHKVHNNWKYLTLPHKAYTCYTIRIVDFYEGGTVHATYMGYYEFFVRGILPPP